MKEEEVERRKERMRKKREKKERREEKRRERERERREKREEREEREIALPRKKKSCQNKECVGLRWESAHLVGSEHISHVLALHLLLLLLRPPAPRAPLVHGLHVHAHQVVTPFLLGGREAPGRHHSQLASDVCG